MVAAASGPIITNFLETVATEFKGRQLTLYEKEKIGAVLYYVMTKINEKQAQKQVPRSDDFFSSPINERSAAEEIAEGVLIAAQREHQEKKLKYLGYLYANIAYNQTISRNNANTLLKIADSLTYQQICLLKVFSEKYSNLIRDMNFENYVCNSEQIGILQEAYLLYVNQLIDNGGLVMTGLRDLTPAKVKLNVFGASLFGLMDLKDMEEEEIKEILALLRK